MGTGYFCPHFSDRMWISFVISSLEKGDGCYFAHGGKVTKTPPGDAFDERLRGAGAHRRLSPGPPFTRAGHFGLPNCSGGQNQDLFPSYSRPTGAFCHQNLLAYASILHRLVRTFLLSAVGVGRVDSSSPAMDQLPRLYQSRRCHFNAFALQISYTQAPVGRGK